MMKGVVNSPSKTAAIASAKRWLSTHPFSGIVDMHGKWGWFKAKTRATAERLSKAGYPVFYLSTARKAVKRNPIKKVSRLGDPKEKTASHAVSIFRDHPERKYILMAVRGKEAAYWNGSEFVRDRKKAKRYSYNAAQMIGDALKLTARIRGFGLAMIDPDDMEPFRGKSGLYNNKVPK